MSLLLFYSDPLINEIPGQRGVPLNNRPTWQIGGIVLPRNPDSITVKATKPSILYQNMVDGSERRTQAPRKIPSRDIELTWKGADRRTMTAAFTSLNFDSVQNLFIDGLAPALTAPVYVDSPDSVMSQESYDPRYGQGGYRQDLKLELHMVDPWFRSLNPVPNPLIGGFGGPPVTVPTALQVQQWFGGPLGINALDFLPAWNGQAWGILAQNNFTTVFPFSNLGTAPWGGKIRFNGPFSQCVLNNPAQDVDGTGAAVTFTWTGPPILQYDYIIFDTQQMRCYYYSSTFQTTTEVYTFTVTAPGSRTPFPYFPPFPSGTQTVYFYTNGGLAHSTSIDLSNGGTEFFRYW